MKFQTDGLIIKEQNIGEQDRLVFALTKSNGIIKALTPKTPKKKFLNAPHTPPASTITTAIIKSAKKKPMRAKICLCSLLNKDF